MDPTSVSLLDQLRGPIRSDVWTRFVRLFTPLMVQWCHRIGVPESEQADLLQDVFVILLRTLPEFEYNANGSFRGWLFTVLANKWKDQCRAKRPEELRDEPEDSADPFEGIDAAEYRATILARAVELLQPEFHPQTWDAFWNTAIEGRPVAAVAAELGVTANVVYIARSRVLQRLRVILKGLNALE